MQVVVYSTHDFDKAFLEGAAGSRHRMVFRTEKLDYKTADLAKGAGAVALFTSDNADAAVLEKLYASGVRYICLRSVGYDHIDIKKARGLGIRVANIPEYSPYAVAEHAVTLLLTLNRKIILGQKLMDICDYRLDMLVGFDLHGKTVGVIGTGRIGTAFAQIMLGFGCSLLAYDPVPNEQLERNGVTYVPLEELYKQSDIISVHCPLNVHTTNLLNAAAFNQMKKGVTLLNTSRGKILDSQALLEALDNGTVALAGLDVYEHEKEFFFENFCGKKNRDDVFIRLRSYPNVLITGHQAFLTHEALQAIAKITVENLDNWEMGVVCPNEL